MKRHKCFGSPPKAASLSTPVRALAAVEPGDQAFGLCLPKSHRSSLPTWHSLLAFQRGNVSCGPRLCPTPHCSHPSRDPCSCPTCDACSFHGRDCQDGERFPDPQDACKQCKCSVRNRWWGLQQPRHCRKGDSPHPDISVASTVAIGGSSQHVLQALTSLSLSLNEHAAGQITASSPGLILLSLAVSSSVKAEIGSTLSLITLLKSSRTSIPSLFSVD